MTSVDAKSRRRPTACVTLRAAQYVGPRWLLKTSSGKTARAVNREKYLAERER